MLSLAVVAVLAAAVVSLRVPVAAAALPVLTAPEETAELGIVTPTVLVAVAVPVMAELLVATELRQPVEREEPLPTMAVLAVKAPIKLRVTPSEDRTEET